jgi:cap2 methyltransferase
MRRRDWNRLAKKTNRMQLIVGGLREQGVEMATIAWAKMYEALMRMEFFPHLVNTPDGPTWIDKPPANKSEPPIRHKPSEALADTFDSRRKACATVHLCEAPGAFVAATNHFIKSHAPWLDWDWRALTLNMYMEENDGSAMVEDEALIAQTVGHWYWGPDLSGARLAPRSRLTACARCTHLAAPADASNRPLRLPD